MLLGVIGANMKDDGSYRARTAIENCWAEQSKKSHAPPDAQMWAKVCETMEQNFRAKYGRNP